MNTYTAKFYKKFFQCLLIGFSAMVLLLAGQQGLFVKPHISDFTLAQEAEGTIPNDGYSVLVGEGTVPNDGSSTLIGSGTIDEAAPAQVAQAPARSDACNPVGSPQGDCSDSVGNTGHHYCEWKPEGNMISACVIEACVYGGTPPDNCNPAPTAQVEPETAPAALALVAETPSQWECERALARGENICNDNITYCEATGWQDSQVVSAVLKSKEQGVCDPSHGERDARGCIFQFLNVRGFNYSTPQNASLFAAASACPAEVSAVAQGAPAAPAQAAPAQAAPAQQVQCVVCDQGRYRLSVMCTNAPTCDINNPNQGPCVGAAVGQACPPRPAPAAPAAPAASATGGSASATGGSASATGGSASATGGSSTVTINNPAVTTREVVRETTRVVTAGNVGVGTTVISGQVLGVKELPKTGLPALVWSVLAFLPAGFKMRGFSRVKKDLQNHPSYIFEDRQFKAGS